MLEGEGTYSVSLPPQVAALPPARIEFARWMVAVEVPGPARDELEIVFSELVTNALRASTPGASIGVRARCRDRELVLEVLNAVRGGQSSVRRWDFNDDLREGGRGLMIVRAFVDSIETDREDGRVLVRCRRTVDRH